MPEPSTLLRNAARRVRELAARPHFDDRGQAVTMLLVGFGLRITVRPIRPFASAHGRVGGQASAMMATAIGAMMIAGVIVVDVGIAMGERVHARAAADFAALAAAQELPESASDPNPAPKWVTAEAVAIDYLRSNGYDVDDADVSASVIANYNGSYDQIEVRVARERSWILGSIFGLGALPVGGRAVAEKAVGAGGGDPLAIFAADEGCAPSDNEISISGQDVVINGTIHSNSGITISGQDPTINGPISYLCDISITGQDPSINPAPQQVSTPVSLPLSHTFAELSVHCTHWLPGQNMPASPAPGVYCRNGNIRISVQDFVGNVSMFATGTVRITGQDPVLTPYHDGILAFSESSSPTAILMAGQDPDWEGILLAPNGGIDFTGQDGTTIDGALIAQTVKISGQNFTLNAYSGAPSLGGDPFLALIE